VTKQPWQQDWEVWKGRPVQDWPIERLREAVQALLDDQSRLREQNDRLREQIKEVRQALLDRDGAVLRLEHVEDLQRDRARLLRALRVSEDDFLGALAAAETKSEALRTAARYLITTLADMPGAGAIMSVRELKPLFDELQRLVGS